MTNSRLRVDPKVGIGGEIDFEVIWVESVDKIDCLNELEGIATLEDCITREPKTTIEKLISVYTNPSSGVVYIQNSNNST